MTLLTDYSLYSAAQVNSRIVPPGGEQLYPPFTNYEFLFVKHFMWIGLNITIE
jgi:hypothetical protein